MVLNVIKNSLVRIMSVLVGFTYLVLGGKHCTERDCWLVQVQVTLINPGFS